MLRILDAAARLGVALTLWASISLAAAPEALAGEPRYAAMVIDGNTGKVLHAADADAPRRPASLTKMMTLYLVFEEMKAGRLTMASRITMTAEAANAQPSKLGLDPGEDLSLADAIKALITKSANDVAIAVAQHIAGSEAAFARRMTDRARDLGMRATTFRNASGLPNPDQITTARDMLTLALHLNDDFPDEFRLFSLRAFSYRGKTHRNHNTLMSSFEGMDGIKTGYTSASGFNVVTSVHYKGLHLVGVVFGGSSAASRNSQMRFLLRRAMVDASTERTRTTKPALVAAPAPAPRPARRVTLADAAVPSEKKSTVAERNPLWEAKSSDAPAPKPTPVPQPKPVPATAAKATPPAPRTAATEPAPAPAPAPARAADDETPVQIVAVKPVSMASLTPVRPAPVQPDPAKEGFVPTVAAPSPNRSDRDLDLSHLGTAFKATAPAQPRQQAREPSRGSDTALAAPMVPAAAVEPASPMARPAAPATKARTQAGTATARPPSTLNSQLALMGGAAPVAPGAASSSGSAAHEGPEPARGRPPSTLQAQAAGLSSGDLLAQRDRDGAWRVGGPLPAAEPEHKSRRGNDVDVEIGVFPSTDEADRRLAGAKSASALLDGYAGLALPVETGGRLAYRARFTGLDLERATEACNALRRRSMSCQVVNGE